MGEDMSSASWSFRPPLMDPSRSCVHSPKRTACPCLCRSEWNQRFLRSSEFCLDWMIWGAQERPAAAPIATKPGWEQALLMFLKCHLKKNSPLSEEVILPVPVYVCSCLPPRWLEGQWAALPVLRRSTPESTLHTPYINSSALAGTVVGETPPEGKEKLMK